MHIKSEQDSKFEIRVLTIDTQTRELIINNSYVLRDECSEYVANILRVYQGDNILVLGYSEQQKGNITKTTVVHQNIQAVIGMLEEKYRRIVHELLAHHNMKSFIDKKRVPSLLLSQESLEMAYQRMLDYEER